MRIKSSVLLLSRPRVQLLMSGPGRAEAGFQFYTGQPFGGLMSVRDKILTTPANEADLQESVNQ